MAGIGNNLYPPIVNTYAPAFIYNSNNENEKCKIYLNISQYNSISEININLVQVSVRDQNTNRSVLNEQNYPNEIMLTTLRGNEEDGFYITISNSDITGGFVLDRYYKVQIRFTTSQVSAPASAGISNWLAENLMFFSEWSSVVLIKGISRPLLQINDLKESQTILLRKNHFEIFGSVFFENEEDTEKLNKYWIEIYQKTYNKLNLIEQSGELISENNKIQYIINNILNKEWTYVVKIQIETSSFYSFPNPKEYIFQVDNDIELFTDIDVQIKQNNNKGCITLNVLNKNYSQEPHKNLLKGTGFTANDNTILKNNSNTMTNENYDNFYIRWYNGSKNYHTISGGIDTISLNSANTNLGISFVRIASEINLDPNSYYTLSCQAQCLIQGATLDIGLSYRSIDHTKGSNGWIWRGGTNGQFFNTKAINDWQKFTLTFKPDKDTQVIDYCFTVKGTGNSSDKWKIKECKLEKGSEATTWTAQVDNPIIIPDYYMDYSNYTLNGSVAYFNFLNINNYNEYKFYITKDVLKDYNSETENITLKKVDLGLNKDMYILVRRTSSRNNFRKWENLGVILINSDNIQKFIWNDFTVQPGVFYKYAFIKCSLNNDWLSIYQDQNKYMIDTWDIFISDQNRQLKILLDPQITNFSIKSNESVIETIGSKYPFIRKNNVINYKTFSLSGTISAFMDLGFNTFDSSKRDLYSDKASDESYNVYELYNLNNNVSLYNDFIYEKFFREEVINFLQKNNVKLFRSLTQGNMLVKLSNITFSPNISLGRRIYSFSCTVYEIAENSIDNINKYKIMETKRGVIK